MKHISYLVSLVLVFSIAGSAMASTENLAPINASEISTAYQQLLSEYYQKTSPQAIADSARAELLAMLKKGGVASPSLPAIHATDSATANINEIEREVERAVAQAQKVKNSKNPANEQLLSYAAISGILDSVHDRYTVFLDPKEFAQLNQGLDGTDFGGIGTVIQVDDATKYISVSNVIPDAPADRAGLQQDDLITAIDGNSTKGLPIDKASSLLRGKIGTNVVLTIQREGATVPPVTITREKIHQLSVYDKMLPGKIGYVALTVFGRDTGDELAAALTRLQAQGARAFVMDLRDNGGGYLDAAVAVSSKFISTGPIVSVESKASNVTTYEADNTAIAPVPLAVLVNAHTASASEITSGAIQDDGTGTIIGTKTFGKGVVQNIYPLPDGSAIKITTARYLTPHNRDINHLGITPDIEVTENKAPRFGNPAKDAQLQRALDYINDRLAHLNTPTT